jgi:hypothetical protein
MEKLSRKFVEYVSEVGGQSTAWGGRVPAQLPQYLAQRYALFEIAIGRRRFLGIILNDTSDFRPSVFEKHLRQIMLQVTYLEEYCLIAQDLPGYVRQRLVERKIPFVVPGRQMYWPELGLAVQARKAKSVPVPADILSPVTQVVLIYALTGGMPEPVTPKILAEKLNYATMSMSRALDEIEANKLGHVGRNGRERLLSFPEGRRTLWQTALPFMRNPVRETVRIRKSLLIPVLRIDAGESALASLSMLVSPKEQVYALGRRSWKRIAGKVETIPVEDKGTCRVQLWRYDPALFSKEGKVDTFSLYLSMRSEEDERIESALEEMMEKVVWS